VLTLFNVLHSVSKRVTLVLLLLLNYKLVQQLVEVREQLTLHLHAYGT
jgi:hypothetical protein